MIPRLRPALGLRELSTIFLPAPQGEIRRFEEAFAELVGQRHAVAFPYGRTGLLALLRALDLREREILCPAYTCVVVPHAVVASGNEPVFVDCLAGDWNMDLDRARGEALEKGGALIATSLFGQPVDLGALDRLRAARPGLAVIQDCAHAFKASWKGRLVLRYGDAALFGLNVSKMITSVFGGMVTTDDGVLDARLRATRQNILAQSGWWKSAKRRLYLGAAWAALHPLGYGLIHALESRGFLDAFTRYYDEGLIAMPADHLDALTDFEARVGRIQVGKYEDIVRRRREVADFYDRSLAGVPGLRLPPRNPGASYSHYTVRTSRREALLAMALERGVQLGRLIEYCIPDMPAYRNRSGYRDCPEARTLSGTCVNLPVWGSLGRVHRKVADLVLESAGS